MKIFISWSGNVSRYVAEGLKEWLKDVNHSLNPWVSSQDIQAGSPWWFEIAKELRDTNFGVICVTRSNLTEPWLLFEAGALAKQVEVTPSSSSGVDHSTVCPYLIDGLRPVDLPKENPLSQFQQTEGTEAGTLFLLKSINSALSRVEPNNAYADDAQIERVFDHWWPDLADRLNNLPPDDKGITAPSRRPQQEIMEETLDLVRVLVRTSHDVVAELHDLVEEHDAGLLSDQEFKKSLMAIAQRWKQR
jgi:hypothetical protein